jgi:ribosome-associated protein
MTAVDFALRGDFIPLDALLKAVGIAPSGGIAKRMVAAGEVAVDGAVELRKTCKIRAGQRVVMGDTRIDVRAGDTGAAEGRPGRTDA